MMNETSKTTEAENVYFFKDGEKAGVVAREGNEWVGYNLSDIETYRGPSYVSACDSVRGW